MNIKYTTDGYGRMRAICKNTACGGFGDGWGSRGGYCTSCKHDANVGCKCTLYNCGEKYWAMSIGQRREANKRGKQ